ncbi:MarR family winged helix-turn-helix transcriptional regulator [Novosphingobium sp. KCTC 2891]|uniref:MarR family winged helix-turn-helix transcriptional regulator n=1 Tax=Novosphingobium sp. KCTC 2891 TaxID=2989730 RepID=UPI0022230EC3|nr:MarR family winged helix-turn-helix transcriptional regulator [Novosphingobium sp. KCTC 2891]MCW1381318.1 MarR family winged helix-turn-helix transcriptional regulator [Novosphingobium sp. KCTC 2891]
MTVRSMIAAGRTGIAARLSPPAPSGQPTPLGGRGDHEAPSLVPVDGRGRAALALAHEFYVGRRRRERFLTGDLFGEPTWDILLDLYVAARENRRVPTTSACIGAHVPPTTALRWLRILEARGLVEREDDGRDGRRTFVRLTGRGLAAMDGWLNGMMVSLERALAHLPPPEAAAGETGESSDATT